MRVAVGILFLVIAALLAWWWLADDEDAPSAATQPTAESDQVAGTDEVDGTVTVLAAASLTESFNALADRLADEYPNLEITYSFGPSSSLAQQAASGAPADVLVTADTRTMNDAVRAGVVDGEPEIIARNSLTLVTPPDNPGEVDGLADLAREELRIAICEPQVPCGAAAEQLLSGAGIEAAPDTQATDVKEALALVTLGEADAALVYQTDAVAAGDAVHTVPLTDDDGGAGGDGGDDGNGDGGADAGVSDDDVAAAVEAVVNDYPAALLADAPNPEAARAFMDALTGEPGRAALKAAGFEEP